MAEHNTLSGTALHEPKGIAIATDQKLYQADGAGSGDWVSPATALERVYGYIAVTSSGQTVVIGAGEVDTWLPFSLTYEAIMLSSNLSFNATTNVITYTGEQTVKLLVLSQISHAASAAATIKIMLQKSVDSGSNWVDNTQSLSARKFPISDLGNMSLHAVVTLDTDDQLRFVKKCDTAMTFTNTNINMSLMGTV